MEKYIDLLKSLISTPSFSKEEEKAAEIMRSFLTREQIPFKTKQNNTWAFNKHFKKGKPVILLNSHIDTVRPAKGYTLDPFAPVENGDKLFGLGSNDAGGPLVALLATFILLNAKIYHTTLFLLPLPKKKSQDGGGWKLFYPKLLRLNLPLLANLPGWNWP
jgi:acetylornithine deacetylase/succinyl-diaminopimelate desuccinylase-like protein